MSVVEPVVLPAAQDGAPGEIQLVESVWRRPSSPAAAAAPGLPGRWAVLDFGGHGGELAHHLTLADQSAVLAVPASSRGATEPGRVHRLDVTRREDVGRWIAELAARPDAALRGVVVLGAFRGLNRSDPDWGLAETLVALIAHLATALRALEGIARPKLVLITTGAQAQTCTRPEWAAVWGLGRVLELEHPEIPCLRVDLDPDWTSFEDVTRDIVSTADERELAYRGGERLVARLERGVWGPERAAAVRQRARIDSWQTPYRLEIAAPGSLDHLSLCATAALVVPDDRIGVEVDHASLSFVDLMKVLGPHPGIGPELEELGVECAGRIVAIGREVVTDLAVGDEVVVTTSPSFQSHVAARPADVIRKPARLSSQQAAAYPCAMITAWYGLHHLASVRAGERVLVHAGTGGLGLAAIDIAHQAGLEVFATASSEHQRAYLHARGVDHVFDSRTLEFAGQIQQLTRGEGVDVVLNSLEGELRSAGLALLRSGGRFLEVCKRNIYSAAKPPPQGIASFDIDLEALHARQPELFRALLEEVTRALDEGRLSPPMVRLLPAGALREAFELMARARHVGKLVVDMTAVADVAARAFPGGRARADGVYLISGGLGPLGRATGEWLAARGAGRIVLLDRGEPTAEARASLERMRGLGARVDTVACEFGSCAALSEVLAPLLHRQLVRGVVHAAGVQDDAALAHLERAQIRRVFDAKVRGACNLDRLTAGMPLDFFVLFSSVASLFGSAGQAVHAAADACLDALAQHRLNRGLPATAINWGPVSEVDRAARGLSEITVEELTRTLERALTEGWPQVGVVRMDAAGFRQANPAIADLPRWSALLPSAGAAR